MTTQLVDRALAAFGEVMEQRLRALDRATVLVADKADVQRDDLMRRIDDQRAVRDREIGALRELVESRLGAMDKATELLASTVGRVPSETDQKVGALRELLGARIDGMDVATKLLAESVAKFPTDLDRAIAATRELIVSQIRNVQDTSLEKFSAIDGTFASNALALTAALAAQKEAAAEQNKSNTLAITKSEQATKETISANAAQTTAGLNSQAATIGDLKERVVRLEAGGLASAASRADTRLDKGQGISVMVAAIMGVTLLVSLASAIFVIARG